MPCQMGEEQAVISKFSKQYLGELGRKAAIDGVVCARLPRVALIESECSHDLTQQANQKRLECYCNVTTEKGNRPLLISRDFVGANDVQDIRFSLTRGKRR